LGFLLEGLRMLDLLFGPPLTPFREKIKNLRKGERRNNANYIIA
jgi:hypothetical protein